MYILEGNIGAGKTTLLKLLGQSIENITIINEPLNSWHNKDQGASLLTHFYKNTERWAFTMEMFALMCRVKEHMRQKKHTDKCIVMERSIYSGYYCFARNSYKQGFMNKMEWEIHKHWFNYLVHKKCRIPTGFIYLKVSPEIAYKRTRKRNRPGEETIPLEYFQQIDKKLDEFLIKKENLLPKLKNIPTLILDCNGNFTSNEGARQQILRKIELFFLQTRPFKPARQILNKESMRNL